MLSFDLQVDLFFVSPCRTRARGEMRSLLSHSRRSPPSLLSGAVVFSLRGRRPRLQRPQAAMGGRMPPTFWRTGRMPEPQTAVIVGGKGLCGGHGGPPPAPGNGMDAAARGSRLGVPPVTEASAAQPKAGGPSRRLPGMDARNSLSAEAGCRSSALGCVERGKGRSVVSSCRRGRVRRARQVGACASGRGRDGGVGSVSRALIASLRAGVRVRSAFVCRAVFVASVAVECCRAS